MLGPGHDLRDCEKIGELPVGHPAVGRDEVMNIRENRREPAKADRREQREMRGQCNRCRWAFHQALALAIPATAMLIAAKPSKTTSSGSLTNAMPVKARAAKSNAVRRLRCGISSRIPVAAAESPPRMFCSTAR